MTERKYRFIPIAAAAIICAYFAWRLRNTFFIREDFTYIVFARWGMAHWSDFFTVSFSQDLWFRQFTILFWKICWLLFGFNPGINYAINFCLLFLTGYLAALLAKKLGAGAAVSGLLAVMIVSHPVSLDATSYLANRGDLLGGVFALSTLLAHLKARRSNRWAAWYALSGLFTMLACLSKEMYITLPVLVMLMPDDDAEEGQNLEPLGITARIGEGMFYFVFVGIFALWRASVIGTFMGGYMNTRTGMLQEIRMLPANAAITFMESAKMFAGITYESVGFAWSVKLAIMAAAALAGWAIIGRKRLISGASLLMFLMVLTATGPVLSLAAIMKVSPRLIYFPCILLLIFLARLLPRKPRIRELIPPIIIIVAWLPLSFTIVKARIAEGAAHKRLADAMWNYYMPRSLAEPENQIKVIFGAPANFFTLDEMFDSIMPENMDYLNTPPATFSFVFGDRINRVAIAKRPGIEYAEYRYRDKMDYMTGYAFNAFENESIVIETIKEPAIVGDLIDGGTIEVSVYNEATGKLSDITSLFVEKANRIKSVKSPIISWKLNEKLDGWQLSPQMILKSVDSEKASFQSTGADPYMIKTLDQDQIDPLLYRYMLIKMRVNTKQNYPKYPIREIMLGTLSWESQTPPPFGLLQRREFPVRADGLYHTFGIDLRILPGWYLSGKLKSIRIDPIDAPCEFEIYSIELIPYFENLGRRSGFYLVY